MSLISCCFKEKHWTFLFKIEKRIKSIILHILKKISISVQMKEINLYNHFLVGKINGRDRKVNKLKTNPLLFINKRNTSTDSKPSILFECWLWWNHGWKNTRIWSWFSFRISKIKAWWIWNYWRNGYS